jgi:type II secretory pathway pseudopilin PulG
MKRVDSEAGFALLDALIALAIIGVISAAFAQVVQGSVLARRQAETATAATHLAQARLDLALERADPAASGRLADFAWVVHTERYAGADNGPGLERVRVEVTRPGTRKVLARLETLRLAR